jgi:hypothetical protein
MRAGVFVGVCLMIVIVSGATTSLFAQALKHGGAAGNAVEPTNPTLKKPFLTQNECWGLGGSIISGANCRSGQVCKTETKDGQIHYLCITKAE